MARIVQKAQLDTKEDTLGIKLATAAAALIGLAFVPQIAEANVSSVTINTSHPFDGAANYTYAEITIQGTVARSNGSTGVYAIPGQLIYPNSGGIRVGVVDWINNAFYHFFGFGTEFGTFQFTRLATDPYLFENGYTYLSVQWDKFVTDNFGANAPNDGQPHNNMVYGSIQSSPDAWEILLDAARVLKNGFPGGPARVFTTFSSGYSMGAAAQLEVITANLDPTRVYDGHVIQNIGLECFKRDDAAFHLGFFGPCAPFNTNHANVLMVVSETDMIAYHPTIIPIGLGAFFTRNTGDPRWRQYEVAGASHIPKPVLDLGVPDQNSADSRPAFRAAFQNMLLWRLGINPPASKFLDGTVDGTNQFQLQYDADGNAAGGLRLPHVSSTVAGFPAGAPLGTYTGLNFPFATINVFAFLGGTFTRFSDAELTARYPTRSGYVSLVALAAVSLTLNRYITPGDAVDYVEQAQVEPLPNLRLETDADREPAQDEGVGCSTTGSSSGALWIGVVAAFLVVRRRRQPAS